MKHVKSACIVNRCNIDVCAIGLWYVKCDACFCNYSIFNTLLIKTCPIIIPIKSSRQICIFVLDRPFMSSSLLPFSVVSTKQMRWLRKLTRLKMDSRVIMWQNIKPRSVRGLREIPVCCSLLPRAACIVSSLLVML